MHFSDLLPENKSRPETHFPLERQTDPEALDPTSLIFSRMSELRHLPTKDLNQFEKNRVSRTKSGSRADFRISNIRAPYSSRPRGVHSPLDWLIATLFIKGLVDLDLRYSRERIGESAFWDL